MRLRIEASRFVNVAVLSAVLFLISSGLFGQNAPKPVALPSVQQVMEHYVAALGGHDAIFRHKSMTVRGRLKPSKGQAMEHVAYYKGGKMLFSATFPDGSRYQEGFNGTVAWQMHPRNGPAISDGDEVKSKERDADMYYPARILDYFSSMDVVDVVDFEGHTCYHLKGTNKWGKINEQFYDTTSGLLIGYRFNSAWRGGSGDEKEVFSDYQDFDGWWMPTRDTNISADGTQVSITTAVSFDDVPDSVFSLPDPIKELLFRRSKT